MQKNRQNSKDLNSRKLTVIFKNENCVIKEHTAYLKISTQKKNQTYVRYSLINYWTLRTEKKGMIKDSLGIQAE
jgi:hypothetical protein